VQGGPIVIVENKKLNASKFLLQLSGCSAYCGGLTLPRSQVPTKAALPLPSSAGEGEKTMTKGSWVEIRTGRDQSPITTMGKTDSTWGN